MTCIFKYNQLGCLRQSIFYECRHTDCSFLLMKDDENKAAELHQKQLLGRQIVHFLMFMLS